MSAAAGAAAAAAIAQAIKASGAIVSVQPVDFLAVLERQDEPLVIRSTGGFLTTKYLYLTSYKGLAFFAKSTAPIELPNHCEIMDANRIWIPG